VVRKQPPEPAVDLDDNGRRRLAEDKAQLAPGHDLDHHGSGQPLEDLTATKAVEDGMGQWQSAKRAQATP
jgi:hypothetical protein